jgi:hypothetical protein
MRSLVEFDLHGVAWWSGGMYMSRPVDIASPRADAARSSG